MIATQNGADIQSVFLKFCEIHAQLEIAIRAQGLDFIRNDRFGYVFSLFFCDFPLSFCDF